MKKQTSFIMLGTLFMLLLIGCGQREVPQLDTESGQELSLPPEPTVQAEPETQKHSEPSAGSEPGTDVQNAKADEDESGNDPLLSAEPMNGTKEEEPLWAQDKMELHPGMEVAGVFDASREIIRLSLEQGDGTVLLFVDGEEKLSVPETCEIRLRDILSEDACLELLVGEPTSFLAYNGEEKEGYRITIYRLHPGELTEVPLLPCGEDNSFCMETWYWEENYINNWYFGAGFFAYIYDSARQKWDENSYRMMPEGYLLAKRDSLAVIDVDGKPLELSEENVKIDEYTGVGIAFAWDWTLAGTSHYNIYRSEDRGRSWSLVMEDFRATAANINYIYILDENIIFCCFYPSGIAPGNSAFVTLDGGKSWKHVDYLDETKKYDFLQSDR